MKYRLFGLFVIAVILFGCGKGKDEHQEYKDVSAFYTGKNGGEMHFQCTVNNPSEAKLYVVVNGKEYCFDVKDKNRIDTTFSQVVPQISMVMYASVFYPSYFADGEIEIVLSGDEDNPAPVQYSGTYQAVNAYLNSGIKTPGKLLFDLDEEKLKKGTSEYLAEAKNKLEASDFPMVFKKLQDGRLLYMMYAEWPQYGYDHAWMTGVDKYIPTDVYFKELAYLAEERKDYCILDEYRHFLVNAIPILAIGKSAGLESKEIVRKSIEYVVDNYKDPLLVQYLIDELISKYVEIYGQDEDLATLYTKYVGDGSKIKAKREETVVADCLFKDVSGREVKFADMADKFIYVLIWDSNAGNMAVEFEALEKIEEQFAKRSIGFVSVFCETDESVWKNTLKQLKPAGEQWCVTENSSFLQTLSIRHTPRYLLLDRNGCVLQDAMPAPSEKGFAMLVAELLEMNL